MLGQCIDTMHLTLLVLSSQNCIFVRQDRNLKLKQLHACSIGPRNLYNYHTHFKNSWFIWLIFPFIYHYAGQEHKLSFCQCSNIQRPSTLDWHAAWSKQFTHFHHWKSQWNTQVSAFQKLMVKPSFTKNHYVDTPLSLSLPKVINAKFLLQPQQEYYTTQYEELGCS